VGALALSACGQSTTASSGSAVTVAGSVLDVWASQTPGAGDAVDADVLAAERLALTQSGAKVGPYTVRLMVAHDRETSANARQAIQDKKAIAYLGEIDPGASGVSVQITNQVGLLQVSPTDTSAYLTQATPAVSDSPGHFYPSNSTFHRTFARVVPTTTAEAKALVSAMASRHLTKLYVAPSDGSDYAATITHQLRADISAGAGLSLVGSAAGADAVFYGGLPGAAATKALDAAAAASPTATLLGPSALYDTAFVSGLSAGAQSHLYVTAPGLAGATLTPSGRQFAAAFRAATGHAPQPQAIFGYEAMSALLSVLRGAGAHAGSRALVVARFRGLKDRSSVLGTYSISNGDPTIAPFVLGHLTDGALVARALP
jgi:ABC-type branched-subunit amino acid transport system substrate-binding protein